MAKQSVTPCEETTQNGIESLIAAACGKSLLPALESLTPAQLKNAESLAGCGAEEMIDYVREIGNVVGCADEKFREMVDVRVLGFLITHLTDYIDTCRYIEGFARELRTRRAHGE